jgi:hypothetical protein
MCVHNTQKQQSGGHRYIIGRGTLGNCSPLRDGVTQG